MGDERANNNTTAGSSAEEESDDEEDHKEAHDEVCYQMYYYVIHWEKPLVQIDNENDWPHEKQILLNHVESPILIFFFLIR